MQTKEFDYDSVPQGFAHCLNEQCPQSADCLRRKAALHIPTDCQFIKIVNPTYTPEMNAKCPYYRSGETVRFACGVAHLYDNLPHNAAVAIKHPNRLMMASWINTLGGNEKDISFRQQ